tara:strand:+ start:906 stop:1481 length:576 start_codon:yes stop_codon:yes gene_type:complete
MKNLLIVGLGNPDTEYESTRHNVGAQFVTKLAESYFIKLKKNTNLKGFHAIHKIEGISLNLLVPSVYMNNSGQSVRATKKYLNLKASEIIIVHDELDLPVGISRYKVGGGHGGHNGVRDIIENISDPSFHRIRIGIGHPGINKDVTKYVLSKPKKLDLPFIETSYSNILQIMPKILKRDWQKAMLELHTKE